LNRDPSQKWKRLFRWLPGVLISLIAIYGVLHFVKLDDLKLAFKTLTFQFFLLIFGLDILGLLIRGKAWQTILGRGVKFSRAFFGVSEGYFLNNIFPFRAGEFGRSFLVGRSSGLSTLYALSTVVIERSFDIAFAGILLIISIPYLVGADWIKPIATIALIIVLALLLVLFLIAKNQSKVFDRVGRIKSKSKIINFLKPRFQHMIEGFSALASPSQFILSLFWIGITWIAWSAVYYFAVAQVFPQAQLWWGVFIASLLALGVAIPSAPAALGVFEASFVGAVAILGGASATALAYAIILHLIQFMVSGIFGIWGLLREGESMTSLFSKITQNTMDNQPATEPEGKI
jgi:glycosyltransferase 2 family protein